MISEKLLTMWLNKLHFSDVTFAEHFSNIAFVELSPDITWPRKEWTAIQIYKQGNNYTIIYWTAGGWSTRENLTPQVFEKIMNYYKVNPYCLIGISLLDYILSS